MQVELHEQTHAEAGEKIPPDVVKRIQRGARSASAYEPVWQEALSFMDNDQWVERSAVNDTLQRVENRDGSTAKPRYRSRLTRNRYTSAILREKSACIARVPVPECSAPSANPEAINAEKMSEKACLGAYHKLAMRNWFGDAMNYAFNCGGGYIWPFWNSGVGKFLMDPITGETLREGEVDSSSLGPGEVLYEPGVPFDKSRWWCVRKAQPVDHVMERADYTGPKELKPDAQAAPNERGRDAANENLVFVYHYLERPSPKYQQGRWLQLAGGFQIAKVEDYPCDVDVPVIHAVEDIRRPHRDRPMGRGELMLDIQRTYNRTINQIIAWKNLILNPQLLAPKGSIRTPRTEEPGAVIEYRPMGGAVPQWREVPEIPMSLFRTLDQCISDWQEITNQQQLPPGIESGTGVAAYNERDNTMRGEFVGQLSIAYSRVFEHVLYLMQRHYTEPRLLEIKTRFGTESIRDFLGAKLMPGITVHINPGSIEPRTRAAQEAKIIMYAERGWLPPHQVMAALQSGNADTIIDDFELDVGKANREIQQLMAMGRGEGYGPVFAAPNDNHQVHVDMIGAWMKTEDFENQPDLVKQAALAHYDQHGAELQWQAMQAAQQQADQAASKGMGAAANGTGDTNNLTSLPGMEGTVRALNGAPAPAAA
jgi:hypothetical protein